VALPSDVLPILVRLAASMVEVVVVTKAAAPVVEDLEHVVALEEALASNKMLDADADAVAVVVAAAVVDAVVAAEATEEEASVVETVFVVLIETTVLNHAAEVTHAAAHLSLVARHHSCSVQKLAAAVAEPIR